MSDMTARLTNVLQDWSTRSLYVGDQAEFRANVKLNLVTKRICFSTFNLHGKQYSLPTTDGYYVYSFSTQLVRGHQTSIGGCCFQQWMNGLDYLNNYQTRLFVYDNYGKLIPLSKIYILTVCDRSFLIINKNALVTCTATGISSSNNMFLTYWINPHPDNAITAQEFTPTINPTTGKFSTDTISAQNAINAIADTATTFTWVLINGTNVDPTLGPITVGSSDYVSIISETDIFCKFTVTIDDNITGYQSDLYQGYREILHMPKALNPSSYILPHDLISVLVRDTETGYSLYQSRYDYRSIRQITHQDYSIDRTDADSLRDTLHATTVSAQVIVRNPVNIRKLGADANYITDLYNNTDSTIVSLLRDSSVSGMDFWSANHLEQSGYISLFMSNLNKSNPADDGIDPDLNFFLSALGFYNTANVLDGGVILGQYKNSTMIAQKPEILKGRNVLPYVFVNGRKILNDRISYSQLDAERTSINITDSTVKAGDNVSVLLKDFSGSKITKFAISSSNTTYNLPTSNVYLYSILPDGFSPLSKSSKTYRTDTVNGQEILTFYPEMYGQTVLIYPEDTCAFGSISIDSELKANKTLTYRLIDKDGNPIQYYNTLDVYLNGYWCVRGVDYVTYTDSHGYTCIAICNRSFLDTSSTGNTVEWYTYGDVTITDDFDYIVNDVLRHTQSSYLFEKNISEVYVEGTYIPAPTDKGSYLSIDGTVDGSSAEHILRFPYYLVSNLPDTARQSDEDRRRVISEYFKSTVPQRPAQVAIRKQHAVYSPWLQGIIQQLSTGALTAVNDPDPISFVNQFPTLDGLKSVDPTLKQATRLNKDYVAIAAAYNLDWPDTAVDVRTVVQKLINLTLIRNLSSLGVTPV